MTHRYSFWLVLVSAFAVSCASMGGGDASNPCNPCAQKNPCATNPCNPCAGMSNPCNPCGANPCNPCGGNPCNPCAGAQKSPAAKKAMRDNIKQPAGTKVDISKSLIKKGKKLWGDNTLGNSGMACQTCHAGNANFMKTFEKPYPHKVAMAEREAGLKKVNAAEMVQLCMVVPMKGDPLPWEGKKLAALTSYVKHLNMNYEGGGKAAGKNPCNPCGGAMGNPCNPCGGAMGKNPCNPCGGGMGNPCNPCAR